VKEYYKIGEISKLYNIGTDSLRYYEEVGILKPKRDNNGYRMYSINDIRTLNILRELRSIGFSINEIKNHLSSFNLQKTKELFENAIAAVDKKVSELNLLKSELIERIGEIDYHSKSEVKYDIAEIRDIEERHILKLSENVLRDDDLDFVIKKLQSEYEDQLYIIGNGDIGATIPLEYLKTGGYGMFDSAFYIVDQDNEFDAVLTGGRYICMTVKGSYSKIPSSWKKLIEFANNSNLQTEGNAIELYIIDNHDTGDEREYITQLQIKIKDERNQEQC